MNVKSARRLNHGAMTLAALLLGLGGCASTPESDQPYLTGPTGMTVYIFDEDRPGSGKSACKGPCTAIWPPVSPHEAARGGNFDTITRDDGSQQLSHRGKPLYYFAQDLSPGEAKGDNVGGVWHVVPSAESSSTDYGRRSSSYGYY